MTTKEAVNKIKNHINAVEKTFILAVASVHAIQTERIFSEGQKPIGEIGKYNSTNPLYINPKTSPRGFRTKGKDGRTKFQNGKSHKTAFFPSYKAYRAAIGRQTNHVDLVLSGLLQSDYRNSIKGQRGLRVWVGAKNTKNRGKIEGAIDKYGNIFDLNSSEKKQLVKVALEELAKECSKQ